MTDEAKVERTAEGLMPIDDGWFVVNARDARWYGIEGGGRYVPFEGDARWTALGFGIHVLDPGERMGMYHGEELHEAFLLLSGEATLIVEGEERPLKAWDFFNCAPWTEHILIGAGDGPAAFITVSNRVAGRKIHYPVSELAQRYGASVSVDTDDPRDAYAGMQRPAPMPYREGDLPH